MFRRRRYRRKFCILTVREHFVCHKLLTYIHKGNYKIYHTFHLMTFMNKKYLKSNEIECYINNGWMKGQGKIINQNKKI